MLLPEVEACFNNRKEFYPHRKENTALLHHRNELVYAVTQNYKNVALLFVEAEGTRIWHWGLNG